MRPPTRNKLGTDVGLLVLRLVAGAALTWHGVLKFQSAGGWMNWMGSEAVFPSWAQGVAAIAETAGGIGLLLGLMTRLAGLGAAAVMGGAVYMHTSNGDPFVSLDGASWEYAAVLGAVALLNVLAGGGRFSLDALLFARQKRTEIAAPAPDRPANTSVVGRPERTLQSARANVDRHTPAPPTRPMGL